jgi:hypothetical protein
MTLSDPSVRHRLTLTTVIVACAVAILRTLFIHSFDGSWVPVDRVLNFTADPPWNHRVLFVWLANGVRHLRPAMSPFQAYFASQVVPTFLALVFTTRWAARFVPRRELWIAPVLMTLILIPTITYRTFFDIGIVAVFALGLDLLFRRELPAFLLVLGIGVLNHEITLFLIPLFLLLYFDRMRRLELFGWTIAQLVVYVGIRAGLALALPVGAFWQGGKLAYNLNLILGVKPELVFGLATLVFWFALGALGWKRVTPLLRRCVWVLPLFVVEVIVVGQLNEARQFDAFFPVLIAVIMQGLSSSPVEVKIGDGVSTA